MDPGTRPRVHIEHSASQWIDEVCLELIADPAAAVRSSLLERPGWRVRLAFFPADASAEKPDYELGMRLLDNGVSQDMVIDYGDYSIRAKLDDIEPLPKPNC